MNVANRKRMDVHALSLCYAIYLYLYMYRPTLRREIQIFFFWARGANILQWVMAEGKNTNIFLAVVLGGIDKFAIEIKVYIK